MNTYDHKHLILLRQIAAGNWLGIPEEDVSELKVLMVCKYVRIEKDSRGCDQVVITTEGSHYFHHLSDLFSMSLTRVALLSESVTVTV